MKKFKSPRDATPNAKKYGAPKAAEGITDSISNDPAKGNTRPTARLAAVSEGVTASGRTIPTAPTNAIDPRKLPKRSPIATMIRLASMLTILLGTTLAVMYCKYDCCKKESLNFTS
jgi:hypothetical protein